jgi:hypothetical protein
MKKKQFITENKRKQILAEKEKAIIESFAKNFNKIKRIDEDNLNSSPNAPDEVLNLKPEMFSVDKKNLNSDEISAFYKPIEINGNAFRLFFYATYDYRMSGGYSRQTLYSPAEYPKEEIKENIEEIYFLDNQNNKFLIPDGYYYDKFHDIITNTLDNFLTDGIFGEYHQKNR